MFGHLRLAHLTVHISLVCKNKPSGLSLIASPLFIHGVKVSQICQLHSGLVMCFGGRILLPGKLQVRVNRQPGCKAGLLPGKG